MAILLVSSIAFSQNAIHTKDSVIVLSKSVAKDVAKDLIKKDSLETELVIVKKNQSLLQTNLMLKDSIIATKDRQIDIYKIKDDLNHTILGLTNEQKANLQKTVDDLSSDVKSLKTKLAVRTTGALLIIGALVYSIVR